MKADTPFRAAVRRRPGTTWAAIFGFFAYCIFSQAGPSAEAFGALATSALLALGIVQLFLRSKPGAIMAFGAWAALSLTTKMVWVMWSLG